MWQEHSSIQGGLWIEGWGPDHAVPSKVHLVYLLLLSLQTYLTPRNRYPFRDSLDTVTSEVIMYRDQQSNLIWKENGGILAVFCST